ncbi:Abi-alpha family protein [Listeria booriae]|uniref:DUF4393 domain-containing protein n=1 Tax=Listeria booriae TaxID=1552123 RepID=A0A7X1CX86_9LIST|nr:Abi-alpha family protein [Listeria booriae]MBC2115027.1 DUF4393 domain-containing protein [Listeria booriae]
MDGLFQNALIPFATALGGGVGARVVSEPLNVLDNWFYKVYGHKSELERRKRELKNSKELELYEEQVDFELKLGQFKEEIAEKISEIPQENIVVPDKHMLAIIMENSRLYLDIDIVRQAFATLISSTMDSEKKDSVHPSYVETIKQLTTKEATLLTQLNGTFGFLFVINIKFRVGGSFGGLSKKSAPIYFFKHIDNSTVFSSDKEAIGTFFYIEQADTSTVFILEKLNLIRISKFNEADYGRLLNFNMEDLRAACLEKIEQDAYFLEYLEDLEASFREKPLPKYDIDVVHFTTYGSVFSNSVCERITCKDKIL